MQIRQNLHSQSVTRCRGALEGVATKSGPVARMERSEIRPDPAFHAGYTTLGATGGYAAAAFAAGGALCTVRHASAVITSEMPHMIRLMPNRSPRVHSAVPGQPEKMIAARIRSMMPLNSSQPHDGSTPRCPMAVMIRE